MNEVIISGRLTTDARVLKSQDANNPWTTCYVTLAVDAGTDKQGQKKAEFIECQAWGKLAETIAQYNHKGDTILVRAHLAMVSAKDRSGAEMKVLRPIVDSFEFGARKQGGQAVAQAPAQPRPQYNQAPRPQQSIPASIQANPPYQYKQPARNQQAPRQMPVYTGNAPQPTPRPQYNQPPVQQEYMSQGYEPQGYEPQGYGYDHGYETDAQLISSDYDDAYIEE